MIHVAYIRQSFTYQTFPEKNVRDQPFLYDNVDKTLYVLNFWL